VLTTGPPQPRGVVITAVIATQLLRSEATKRKSSSS
jgi:hypothetical protein